MGGGGGGGEGGGGKGGGGGGGVTSGMWSPASTRGEGALYWLQEYRLIRTISVYF